MVFVLSAVKNSNPKAIGGRMIPEDRIVQSLMIVRMKLQDAITTIDSECGYIEKLKMQSPIEVIYPICPDCNERLYQESGCNICRNCGYSKCG